MDSERVANSGVLIDTGPIVALLSERDQYHSACAAAAKLLRGPLLTCWPVITESAFLLQKNPEILSKLFEVLRTSKIKILALDHSDITNISDIFRQYKDQRFDLADVALMHLAIRGNISAVFTIDVRHFAVFRSPQGNSIEIVPVSK
jgi:uncharacterized protein